MKKMNLILVALMVALLSAEAQSMETSSYSISYLGQNAALNDSHRIAGPDSITMAVPEEEYVDDIPFNTELIVNNVLLMEIAEREDESEINDIPFNTEKIYHQILMEGYIAEWKEEPYEDDIPFDTRYLVCCKCMMSDFLPSCVEDPYVDRICYFSTTINCRPAPGLSAFHSTGTDVLSGMNTRLLLRHAPDMAIQTLEENNEPVNFGSFFFRGYISIGP